jgi:AcrR family transcriptional regulator
METQLEIIVITACRLFEQFGIRSVSIDNVCTELRISKKTFYTFFPQKENLVDAVLTFQRTAEFEKYDKLLKNKNAIESLMLIIREIKKKDAHEPQAMFNDIMKYYPKIHEKFENLKRQGIRVGFEMNLKQGIEEGYYRDDLDIELISYFHSIQIKTTFEQMTHDATKFSKKRLIDFFIDLMIHLIANEKGLKYMSENYNKSE